MADDHDHYLARTHLRGFAHGRRLWQLDLSDGTIEKRSVRDVAVARGMNTVRRDGQGDRTLEQYMSGSNEGPAGPILQKLRESPMGELALSSEQRMHLARYVALTYARSPHQRETSRDLSRAVARQMATEFGDAERFARRARMAGVRIDDLAIEIARLRTVEQLRRGEVPAGVQVWPIAVGAALARPPRFIAAMRMFVVRRASAPWLICGDTAVVLMYDNRYDAPGDLGFARNRDVRVIVPLSADRFFVAGFVELARTADRLAHWSSDGSASFVNCASLDHASRFAWGREREHLERARAEIAASRVDAFTPAQVASVIH